MIKKSDMTNSQARKAQTELQNKKISETLGHIQNKIEVFKTLGGRETARKENLRLLATLPLELEVVREGDAGVVSLLDNRELLITREFSKMVDEVVKLTGFNPRSTSFETPKASRSEN